MRHDSDETLYAALGERLRAHGLARAVDELLRLAQPAIHLDLTRAEDEEALPLGVSKVGGEPDLPTGSPWPTSHDGATLPFIAQVHLADIAQYDPDGDLPHHGLLSFFYAMNGADGELRIEDDPTAWRIVWTHDNGAPLSRLATPATLIDALDSRFPACSVSFARRLTLPGLETPTIQRLGLTNNERLGYIEVYSGIDVGYLPEMDLHLLGFPYELEPFPFTAAYLAEHNLTRPIIAMTEARQSEMRQAMEHARELDRRAADEWRLLFQVYSNDVAEMDWAGGGVIHFGVKRAALTARDFSQAWVSLQFL